MISIQTISKEELAELHKRSEVPQVINVLDPKFYNLGFIRGSKGIPLSQLDSRLGELDKTKEVIVYCASMECDASKRAAEFLGAKGFRVRAYEGGIKEWKEAGLPVETMAEAA